MKKMMREGIVHLLFFSLSLKQMIKRKQYLTMLDGTIYF